MATKEINQQVKDAQAAFREVGKKVDRELEPALVKCALVVERYAKENMSPDGPSLPGQPPAVDTGRLRASISHRIVREGNTAVAEVGTNVDYAPHLEFGTSKMAARPFMNPALEANRNKIKELLSRSVKEATDGAD